MGELRERYKRRKDFTEEEWKEKVREAWRLRAKYGWVVCVSQESSG